MTREEGRRINELLALIVSEKDPEKIKAQSAELERLLTIELNELRARSYPTPR
jgi:hypothetical protein